MNRYLHIVKLDGDFVKLVTKDREIFDNFIEGLKSNGGVDFDLYIKKEIKKEEIENGDETDKCDFLMNILAIRDEIKKFKNQKMKVVCEFIEDEGIGYIFSRMGVDFFQGYYFSKPFNSDELKNIKEHKFPLKK